MAWRLPGRRPADRKEGQAGASPLFKAPSIDIAISWDAILRHREIVGEVVFKQPHLNFVDGGDSGDSQSGEGVDWRDQLDALVPITLNEIRVVDGQLSFRNFSSDPQVHVYASDIQASLYNLTNTDDADGTRTATFEGTGKLFNQAPIEATARFDPFTDWEDFEVNLRVTGVPLKQLNDLSRAYGKFDFAGGTGDLVVEVEASNSQLDGYIKPLLRNVDIFDYEQDVANEDKGFFRGLWEAVVGGGQEVLKTSARTSSPPASSCPARPRKRTSARSRRSSRSCAMLSSRPLPPASNARWTRRMIRGRHQKHAHGHSVTE